MLFVNCDGNAALIEAIKKLKEGKNELVLAAIALESTISFPQTIKEIKETIGDITTSIKLLEDYLGIGG